MSFDKTVPNLAGVQVEDKQGIHRNDVAQKAFETNLPKPFVDGDHNIANLFLLAQLKESDQRNAGLEMETTMCLEIMRELAIERNMWRDLCCKLCEKYDAYIELMRSRINKLEQEKRPVPHFMS